MKKRTVLAGVIIAVGGCSAVGSHWTKKEPSVVQLSANQYGVEFAAKDASHANEKLKSVALANCTSGNYEISNYNTQEAMIYQLITATVNCK